MKSKTPCIQILIAIVPLFALAFLTGCGGSDDPNLYIEKAEGFVAENNYAAAEIELRNALKIDRQNASALSLIGEVYSKQGRIRDAYQALSAAKQANPNDARSLATLAAIEMAAGLRKEAFADAKQALELDPSHSEAPIILAELASDAEAVSKTDAILRQLPPTPEIHVALGALKLKQRQVEAAQSEFLKALELDPQSPTALAAQFQVLVATNQPEKAKEAFSRAVEFAPARSGLQIRYGQYLQLTEGDEAAEKHFEALLNQAPDYLPALTAQAELKAKMQKNEEAKKLVEKALRLDRVDATALRVSAALSLAGGKTEEAIKQYEQILQLFPNDLISTYQAALAYIAKRDFGKAKSNLSKVLAASPGHLEATALMSSIQGQEEDFTGAIITLENFLKLNPNSIEGNLLLAEIYNKKGDTAAAVSIYEKLEDMTTDKAQIAFLSGVSFLKGKDRSNARSSFETALSTDPLHLQSVEQLTILDVGERNFDSALDRIDSTIEASPNSSALYTIKAQILERTKDLEAAEATYQKAIELDPANRSARMLYARLLQSEDKAEQAFEQLQAVARNNAKDIPALTAIAGHYERIGDYDKAVATYKKILETDANEVTALNNLAYLYSTRYNRKEEAFQLAQKARELAPNNPYTADTLGWIVYERGDYDWALSLLRDSYNKLSQFAEVAYHLGAAHYSIGNRSEAIRLLTQATESDDDFTGKEEARKRLSILKIDTDSASSQNITAIEKRLSEAPSDSYAYTALARLQLTQGKSSDAKANFERALDLSKNNAAAKIGIAEIMTLEPANANKVYSLAGDVRQIDRDNQSARALQGISLSQQGKAEQAKSMLGSVNKDVLPKTLRDKVEATLAELEAGN
ncbi:tetratricopeptide repeat protein [Pelagicoccus sp. SDUM812003]|uniref:tetratricopeptide repeat protein n=1 Tax=Pelagicoccus sp. SDUM812003 TaxID=3041267 RepID=UPI00280E4900|nr:tetratricopeptide repeat protein [Pelagicoccus sp. SDUM812003]MDQ8205201.1 tetratricopeptide repeat protein [Pelagicoccus sp. SDUM812003]